MSDAPSSPASPEQPESSEEAIDQPKAPPAPVLAYHELLSRYLLIEQRFDELLSADRALTVAYHALSQLKMEQDVQLELTNARLEAAQKQCERLSAEVGRLNDAMGSTETKERPRSIFGRRSKAKSRMLGKSNSSSALSSSTSTKGKTNVALVDVNDDDHWAGMDLGDSLDSSTAVELKEVRKELKQTQALVKKQQSVIEKQQTQLEKQQQLLTQQRYLLDKLRGTNQTVDTRLGDYSSRSRGYNQNLPSRADAESNAGDAEDADAEADNGADPHSHGSRLNPRKLLDGFRKNAGGGGGSSGSSSSGEGDDDANGKDGDDADKKKQDVKAPSVHQDGTFNLICSSCKRTLMVKVGARLAVCPCGTTMQRVQCPKCRMVLMHRSTSRLLGCPACHTHMVKDVCIQCNNPFSFAVDDTNISCERCSFRMMAQQCKACDNYLLCPIDCDELFCGFCHVVMYRQDCNKCEHVMFYIPDAVDHDQQSYRVRCENCSTSNLLLDEADSFQDVEDEEQRSWMRILHNLKFKNSKRINPLSILSPGEKQRLLSRIYDDEKFAFIDQVMDLVTSVQDADLTAWLLIYLFDQVNGTMDVLKHVIAREVDATTDPATMFRGNSIASKMLKELTSLVCGQYLQVTSTPIIEAVMEAKGSFEIDPLRLDNVNKQSANMDRLLDHTQYALDVIYQSANIAPAAMRQICIILRGYVGDKFPESRYSCIGGFVFLRVINPALSQPTTINEAWEVSSDARRGLLLMCKVLQNLANGLLFGSKETYMQRINPFLEHNREAINNMFDDLASPENISHRSLSLREMQMQFSMLEKRVNSLRKNSVDLESDRSGEDTGDEDESWDDSSYGDPRSISVSSTASTDSLSNRRGLIGSLGRSSAFPSDDEDLASSPSPRTTSKVARWRKNSNKDSGSASKNGKDKRKDESANVNGSLSFALQADL